MTHSDENTLEPAEFLVRNLELLPRGRVLDIAMGNGRNTIYLAKAGFEAEGIDISEEAVNAAIKASRESGVSINAEVTDLENGYEIEPGAYDLIICFNYLHRPLIPQIKNGIRPGGMAVYETFIIDQAKFGRPRNPDHLLEHNELLEMFREFRCLRYHEGIIENRKAVAGIIAQKMERDR
jgi:2-polyprenyl-3-methyl-5-hydroxy-6-metoxy-1,4-benzoquinol methylase